MLEFLIPPYDCKDSEADADEENSPGNDDTEEKLSTREKPSSNGELVDAPNTE